MLILMLTKGVSERAGMALLHAQAAAQVSELVKTRCSERLRTSEPSDAAAIGRILRTIAFNPKEIKGVSEAEPALRAVLEAVNKTSNSKILIGVDQALLLSDIANGQESTLALLAVNILVNAKKNTLEQDTTIDNILKVVAKYSAFADVKAIAARGTSKS
jgi:hypothetical protein